MHLTEISSPDTAAALAANQVARRYCSAALYAHSVRSYLWAVAYAEQERFQYDPELLYVAALLHDIGLTLPFDAHEMPFEEAGGHVAWVVGAAAGWPDERRDHVSRVIAKHMSPGIDPADDIEAHLLEVATAIDITGRGFDLVPDDLRTEIDAAWPRLTLAAEFAECLRVQGERKPTSRAAVLVRAGLAGALRSHPFEKPGPRASGR